MQIHIVHIDIVDYRDFSAKSYVEIDKRIEFGEGQV